MKDILLKVKVLETKKIATAIIGNPNSHLCEAAVLDTLDQNDTLMIASRNCVPRTGDNHKWCSNIHYKSKDKDNILCEKSTYIDKEFVVFRARDNALVVVIQKHKKVALSFSLADTKN